MPEPYPHSATLSRTNFLVSEYFQIILISILKQPSRPPPSLASWPAMRRRAGLAFGGRAFKRCWLNRPLVTHTGEEEDFRSFRAHRAGRVGAPSRQSEFDNIAHGPPVIPGAARSAKHPRAALRKGKVNSGSTERGGMAFVRGEFCFQVRVWRGGDRGE